MSLREVVKVGDSDSFLAITTWDNTVYTIELFEKDLGSSFMLISDATLEQLGFKLVEEFGHQERFPLDYGY